MATLTDSAPVDKVNFIRAYSKAREAGMTSKNIVSGFRTTGNWPISRRKALTHPEIQPDRKDVTPEPHSAGAHGIDSESTPTTSRQIRDLGKNSSPGTRRRYAKIARGFEAQEMALATKDARIAGLEEELDRLKRGKKRKAVPNPNRRFMQVSEALAAGQAIPEIGAQEEEVEAVEVEEEIEVALEASEESSDSDQEVAPPVHTRSGRLVKKTRRD